MSEKSVYLAGPITGLSYDGATDWRRSVIEDLRQVGIRGYSPMRAKEYLAHLDHISGSGREYEHLGVLSTSRGVMTRDRFDATRCDVLLVNFLGAKAVSIGTVMEIAWADANRIPIVCAVDQAPGHPHDHMMVNEAIGFKVHSLEEAVHIVKAILLQ